MRRPRFVVGLAFALAACGSGGGLVGGTPGGGGPTPPSNDASLAALAVSTGALAPAFSAAVTTYALGPAILGGTLVVSPTATEAGAVIRVNGIVVASGSPSAAIPLLVGVNVVTVVVTAPDAVTTRTYTIVATRVLGQQAYVKASNTDSGDVFGWSVAIDGDTLVAGAYGERSDAVGVDGDQSDDGLNNAGAAYVFVRAGPTWQQQAYLKASNTDAGDEFGFSVAIDGDTIVVGADGEASAATGVDGDQADDSLPFAGAAYVFVRSGTTWSQQAYLKASRSDSGDQFGYSVGISGDTIVVGAPNEDSSANVIGANAADDGASDSGAAYVFVRTGSTWTKQAYLKPDNTGPGDQFGFSAAIDADTVVVGALEDSSATGVGGDGTDNGQSDAGAAYVFVRTTDPAPLGTWDIAGDFSAPNAQAVGIGPEGVWSYGEDLYGFADLSGYVAFDLFAFPYWRYSFEGPPPDASVGPRAASPPSFYSHEGGTGPMPVPNRSAVANWTTPRDMSVAMTVGMWTPEDGIQNLRAHDVSWRLYDTDGTSLLASNATIIGGAHGHASYATRWTDGATLDVEGGQTVSFWHTRRDIQGYVGIDAGFDENPPAVRWVQQAYLKASNTENDDEFGYAVAISGNTLVVGAALEDSDAVGVDGAQGNNGAPQSGAAYVFVRTGLAWAQQAYLKPTNTDVADQFGWHLGISADTIVVGSAAEDSAATGVDGDGTSNAASASGAAYVYARSGGVWTPRSYLKASNTEADDQFGFSSAISGDTIVVGAYTEDSAAVGIGGNPLDNSADGSGAVYVFR